MRKTAIVCVCFLMLGLGQAVSAEGDPPRSEMSQVHEGVYEWTDEDGATHRTIEGTEGLDWLIQRVEGEIETLATAETVDPDALSAMIQHHTRLLGYQEKLQDNQGDKAGCFCLSKNLILAQITSGYLPFLYAESIVDAGPCSGYTYDAMSVAVAVKSDFQKSTDCEYEGGSTVYTDAHASWGYDNERCLRAVSYLWIDAPAGCLDRVIIREDAWGDHQGECNFSPCG